MAEVLGSEARPLRVAVIGSGPSGFYAAEALLADEAKVLLDMYDRLPAPFGLVRYGVAPDHGKIKNIIKRYEKTAGHPDFAFFGNVRVGEDVSVAELERFYDVIVFASGAQTDRRLGVPGEDLPGSYTATEFVAWYNGHPEYRDRTFDLSREVAVVVGQGNVAVDVARILCKTVDELKTTDIAQYALDALAESKVRRVHMIGRRGPVQAAFTPPEIKEFGALADCDPVVDPQSLELGEASRAELEVLKWRDARKNYDILCEYSQRGESSKSRRFVVEFYRSPKALLGEGHLERVVLEKNRLEGEPGKQKARGTGETYEMDCGVLFRSVGYRGVAIPDVPFDEQRGTIPNVEGRVSVDGDVVPGLYAVGWIKRGPSGIIGTNKPCSFETARHIVEDIPTLTPCPEPSRESLLGMLRSKGIRLVDYSSWQRIDAAEIQRGEAVGKPREKFITIDEMIDAGGS